MSEHDYYSFIDAEETVEQVQLLDNVNVDHLQTEGDEFLIDLIKNYPHIFDKGNKDYKDALKRKNSWEEIASSSGLTSAEVENRWKRLRERYAKERRIIEQHSRSGAGNDNTIKKWILYDSMKFIDKYVQRRSTVANLKRPLTPRQNFVVPITHPEHHSIEEQHPKSYEISKTSVAVPQKENPGTIICESKENNEIERSHCSKELNFPTTSSSEITPPRSCYPVRVMQRKKQKKMDVMETSFVNMSNTFMELVKSKSQEEEKNTTAEEEHLANFIKTRLSTMSPDTKKNKIRKLMDVLLE